MIYNRSAFHLVPFELKYLDDIHKLFHDTVHAINARDYSQEQITAWAPELIDRDRWARMLSSSFAYVALMNDRVVGFGDATSDGTINHLYTHKDYQGYGIATAILGKLEQKLRENGIIQATTEASITAQPFFEKRGYATVKSQEMVHRSGVVFKNFVMTKNLEGSVG